MKDYFADCTWIAADPTNYFHAGRKTFRHVVIHITDGHVAALPVASMWRQPHHGSSAHFVVSNDGSTLIQAVKLSDIAWHAHAVNADSVGVEHCARTPGELGSHDSGLAPTDAQYLRSARLVAWLCKEAGQVPDRDTIQGHCEIDKKTDHDDCPNGVWDWMKYMQLVTDEYARLP